MIERPDSASLSPAFSKALDRLESAKGDQGLTDTLHEVADVIGDAAVSYSWLNRDSEPWGISTYPEAWLERYFSQNYLAIDPIVVMSPTYDAPFWWSDVPRGGRHVEAFFQDAIAHGVGVEGLGIPGSHGAWLQTIFSIGEMGRNPNWRARVADLEDDLVLIANLIDWKVSHLFSSPLTRGQMKLSTREIECARLLARGYKVKDIAQMLGISAATVQDHINGLKRKMNAKNSTQAVCRAARFGVIVP